MVLWQKLLLVLLLKVTAVSSVREHFIKNTYYIIPTPNTPCPGDPCHNLSQFSGHATTGEILPQTQQHWCSSQVTTLSMLPQSQWDLHVSNYTAQHNQTPMKYFYYSHPSLILLGNRSSLPDVTCRIVCTWPVYYSSWFYFFRHH